MINKCSRIGSFIVRSISHVQHITLLSHTATSNAVWRVQVKRKYSTKKNLNQTENIEFHGQIYEKDEWTNITPKIISSLNRKLYMEENHPLCIIKRAITDHFYKSYTRSRNVPIFTVIEDCPQIVSVEENFDNLLVPKDHISRQKSDNYYINSDTLLRAHTTAHEVELIRSGFDAFLTIGDVYRRDTIDATHYPVFHQVEGVRLFTSHDIFSSLGVEEQGDVTMFEGGVDCNDKQGCYSLEASKLVEFSLKQTIQDCMKSLFGNDIEWRWVDAYFPFTHPSFELEIKFQGEWVEMLGCGVLRHKILEKGGAGHKIGWAFGFGLERLAMRLFSIPDIRYFWSSDPSVLGQFKNIKSIKDFEFKIRSKQPILSHDISFWVPDNFNVNDFYDLIRNFDSDLIESVYLVDEFTNKKTGRTSHCYRLHFRHLSRPLTQEETNVLNNEIKKALVHHLEVEGRW